MNMLEDEVNGNILPTQSLLNMPSSSPTLTTPIAGSPQRISGSSTESFPSPDVKKKHTDFESKSNFNYSLVFGLSLLNVGCQQVRS